MTGRWDRGTHPYGICHCKGGLCVLKISYEDFVWLVLPSWDREMPWDDQGMWIAVAGVCQGDVSWAVQWVQVRGGHAEGRKRHEQLKIAIKTRGREGLFLNPQPWALWEAVLAVQDTQIHITKCEYPNVSTLGWG